MTQLQKRLQESAEEDYRSFIKKLVPTVEEAAILGVRVPKLRQIAKEYGKEAECQHFLDTLPHRYYEENLLHALLLTKAKDFRQCINAIDAFLPFVDNWAVCDTLRPAVFAKHKEELLPHIRRWMKSDEVYTCRFGLEALMNHGLDDFFQTEFIEAPLSITSDEYYVRLMIAWFYATALAKQWDSTLPVLEQRRLPKWVHQKAIQKACESYRLTPEQKEYLKILK
ncbi:MAG TPA: DNA alkylation repair protein [Ruminococcaceae bacterium]|nr:DNA alkylation repair protein [Oscillospiraceae bacterium]